MESATYRHRASRFIVPRRLYGFCGTLGVHDDVTAFAWRGKAIESAAEAVIAGAADEQAVVVAMQAFEKHASGEIAPEIDRERQSDTEPWCGKPRRYFANSELPVARQRRIEVAINGIEVPIIGYADFVYDGVVLELKTTYAIPSRSR